MQLNSLYNLLIINFFAIYIVSATPNSVNEKEYLRADILSDKIEQTFRDKSNISGEMVIRLYREILPKVPTATQEGKVVISQEERDLNYFIIASWSTVVAVAAGVLGVIIGEHFYSKPK